MPDWRSQILTQPLAGTPATRLGTRGPSLLQFATSLLLVAITACSGTGPGGTETATKSTPSPTHAGRASTPPVSPTDTGTAFLAAVELRPEDPSPGGQFALLVNGSDRQMDLACWQLRSAATGTSATIVVDESLSRGAGLRLFPDVNAFGSPDTISLFDAEGREVDRTPRLTDQASDDQLWYRGPGGTWEFGRQFVLPDRVIDGRLLTEFDDC